jgi:hypothetical protein
MNFMHSRYSRLKIKALREKGKRMAQARWAKDRSERDALMPVIAAELREREILNIPHKQGDLIGILQWTDTATGKVRRWPIKRGDRADRITIGTNPKSHGWAWFFSSLRKKILNH